MENLKSNLIKIHGEKGKAWLDALPELTKKLSDKYGLSDLKVADNLSYNYVLLGFQAKQAIALKCSLDEEGLTKEAVGLKAFEGSGVAKVLAQEPGMLLLEQAIPGKFLIDYFPKRDDEAILIVSKLITRLHQSPIAKGATFPHIRDCLKKLDQDLDIPKAYLDKARQVRDQLLDSAVKPVLLHGDLHHNNILEHGTDWLIIDPKGFRGEATYEVAAFIRNPLPGLFDLKGVASILNKRVNGFAQALDLDPRRIQDWSYVQAVLAWAWALEDGTDVAPFRELTEIFAFIKFIK